MSTAASFERAFVAVSYLLGRRADLLAGLSDPSDAARRTALIDAPTDRIERARLLASELLPIATAVDERRLR